jgi:hypothetical protein
MRYALVALLLCVGCVHESDDYTPQIHVVPGAAARATWLTWPSSRLPPSPPLKAAETPKARVAESAPKSDDDTFEDDPATAFID